MTTKEILLISFENKKRIYSQCFKKLSSVCHSIKTCKIYCYKWTIFNMLTANYKYSLVMGRIYNY